MNEDDVAIRLARLSGAARRLLDYVAVQEPARYVVLRHLARVSEEDLVEDLKEVVGQRLIESIAGQPNSYVFTDDDVRQTVLAQIGETRLPKLQARVNAARHRVEGP